MDTLLIAAGVSAFLVFFPQFKYPLKQVLYRALHEYMANRRHRFPWHLEWWYTCRVILLKSVVLSLITVRPCNCSATRLEKIPQL